ncbi:MAG: hypothetical protein ONB44_24075 [candidate division KSB1 bacterium]|nr:hypothetical protein [candidate division KSB1 bacterium]MDZ7305220.1 hypothetical protein [candidate division KSB1 bacterium]MDZ7314331.1 hypothetical protein [candidate division KSB1 bacterium]
MDKRSRASLTYRIITEVLGLALVLGAFSLSLVSEYTAPLLVRNLAVYGIVFIMLIFIWWRLGSMYEIGLLGGKVSAIVGMVLAFNIALAPVLLKLVLATHEAVRELAAILLTASFVIVTVLLAFLVHRSHAYRSKSQWRVMHHALWLMAVIFLASLFVPLSLAPFAEIPARFLSWGVALVFMLLYQGMAARFMSKSTQNRQAGTPASAQASSSPAAAAASSSSSSSTSTASDEKKERSSHDRYPRRGRGRFRRYSGSRRRM